MKTINLFVFMLLFLLPSACALSLTSVDDGETLQFYELDNLSFTITDMDTSLYNYRLFYSIGQTIQDYPLQLSGTYADVMSGDIGNISVTSSSFTLDLNGCCPFEQSLQNISTILYEYYKSNGTEHQRIVKTISFNISGADNPLITTYASVMNCDPPNFDFNANRIVGRGLFLRYTALRHDSDGYIYAQVPIYFFLTDNESKLLNWGNGNYCYQHDSAYGQTAYGFRWVNITWGKTALITNYSGSYYIYIGVPLSDGRNNTNTLLSVPDATMAQMNFTIDNFNKGSMIYEGTAKTYDYMGAYIYFETAPTKTSLSYSFTIGGIGLIIRNYGTSIGLPWFHLVIALVIVVFFLIIPWKLQTEYDLHIPNFVYLIMLSAGMVADFVINLIDFWMLILFISVMVLTMVVKYREDIEKIVQLRYTGMYAKAKKQEVKQRFKKGTLKEMADSIRGKKRTYSQSEALAGKGVWINPDVLKEMKRKGHLPSDWGVKKGSEIYEEE